MPSGTNPIRKEKRREMLKEKKQRNFLSSLNTDAVLDCMVTQTSKTLTTNMNNRTVFLQHDWSKLPPFPDNMCVK
jgi:hypothetical protein